MRRIHAAFLAVALLAVPAMAQAQMYMFIGGVASVPLSDTKDVLKTGYMVDFGIGKAIQQGGNVSVNVEGLVGTSDEKGVGGGSTTLYGGFVNLEGDLNAKATLHPYGYVGGGVLSVHPDVGDSKSKGAYQAGAGLAYKLSQEWTLWGDVRYLGTGSGSGLEKTTLLPISIGFSWSGASSM
jgi:opacity protein-like surface antigen